MCACVCLAWRSFAAAVCCVERLNNLRDCASKTNKTRARQKRRSENNMREIECVVCTNLIYIMLSEQHNGIERVPIHNPVLIASPQVKRLALSRVDHSTVYAREPLVLERVRSVI